MPMKLGEYYTIDEAAAALKLSPARIINHMTVGDLKVERFAHSVAIHEDALVALKELRIARGTEAKREAQALLRKAGFICRRNPPPEAPRGNAGHPSPFRRGWSKNGVYYGLTAVEALCEWQRAEKRKQPTKT